MTAARPDPLRQAFPLTEKTRNLVRFCQHLPHEALDASFAANFGFRDAGSRFCILKSVHTAPGPDECFGLFARDDRALFRKLLGLEVEYVGLTAAQQARLSCYNTMNYYRSHIVENFCHNGLIPMPPTEGECVMWFAAPDVLRISYRLVNKADVPVPVRLRWAAEGEPGLGFAGTANGTGFAAAARNQVIRFKYSARAELCAEDADVSFSVDGTAFSSNWVEREVPARGHVVCRFAVRFTFNDEPLPDWPRDLWNEESLVAAIAETEAAYAELPALDRRMQPFENLALKAVGTLRSLRYRDLDMRRRPVLTMHVGKSGTAATWFWDTGISLLGLGLMHEREAAVGAIRILTEGIKADGTPPVTYEHQNYVYAYQIPLLTWGVGHYLAKCPDRKLLRDAYGPLSRYVRHWFDRYSTAHGLVVYPLGCTSLDDAVRWHSGSPLVAEAGQAWHAKEWGGSRPDLFEQPDTNAFLYLELRTLASMARALGKPAEARDWDARARRLATAINRWLLDPVTNTYQDRHVESGAFTGLVNMGSFIPVYAGITPRRAAEKMCREYLLSPEHFLTAMPFPVVDRAHPTFRSGGFLHAPPEYPGALVQQAYWRGRTWIHGDYWLLGALWRAGLRREADEIATRILAAVDRSEGINECYDSLTGFGNGHPEFMWSSAAVLMLALRDYRRPPVARLVTAGS